MEVNRNIIPVLQTLEDILRNREQIFWMITCCDRKIALTAQGNAMIGVQEQDSLMELQTFFNQAFGRDKTEGLQALSKSLDRHDPVIEQEFRMMGRDGTVGSWHMKGHRLYLAEGSSNGCKEYYTGVMVKKKMGSDLRQLKDAVYRDAITELPNRVFFNYKAAVAIEQAREFGKRCAILSLDIDHFNKINDLYGQTLGDVVLRAVSVQLSDSLRGPSLLARPGGDEYLLLLEDLGGTEDLSGRMTAIQGAFSEPVRIDDYSFQISLSAGAVVFPEDGSSLEELIRHADMALRLAKDHGRNRFVRYDSLVGENTARKNQLSHLMAAALGNGEFSVHYQPQMRIDGNRLSGAEALLRWNSPEFGQVSPAEFIPIAEETGFIRALGAWVLETVVAQVSNWNRVYGNPIPIAVNLSALQLEEEHLCQHILKVVSQHSVLPEQIILEITESALLENYQATCEKLRVLRLAGFLIALDDFGTGYSSLSHLKNLPIDILKIDKTFIDRLGENHTEDAIIQTIISLAHILRLEAVAEGVEAQGQRDILGTMGCNKIQGYWFGKPLDNEAFAEKWLSLEEKAEVD